MVQGNMKGYAYFCTYCTYWITGTLYVVSLVEMYMMMNGSGSFFLVVHCYNIIPIWTTCTVQHVHVHVLYTNSKVGRYTFVSLMTIWKVLVELYLPCTTCTCTCIVCTRCLHPIKRDFPQQACIIFRSHTNYLHTSTLAYRNIFSTLFKRAVG